MKAGKFLNSKKKEKQPKTSSFLLKRQIFYTLIYLVLQKFFNDFNHKFLFVKIFVCNISSHGQSFKAGYKPQVLSTADDGIFSTETVLEVTGTETSKTITTFKNVYTISKLYLHIT